MLRFHMNEDAHVIALWSYVSAGLGHRVRTEGSRVVSYLVLKVRLCVFSKGECCDRRSNKKSDNVSYGNLGKWVRGGEWFPPGST